MCGNSSQTSFVSQIKYMATYPFLIQQMGVRQTREQLAELAAYIDTLPEANKPQTTRELFEHFFRTVRKQAETIAELTAQPQPQTTEQTPPIANEETAKLHEENLKLKYELETLLKKGTSEVVATVLTKEATTDEVEWKLETLRLATSTAFKVLFRDINFGEISRNDLLELMLDYCERDPSDEFPFEPVARKIYEEQKKATNEGQ